MSKAEFGRYVVVLESGLDAASKRRLTKAVAQLGSLTSTVMATSTTAVFGVVTDLHAAQILDVVRQGDETLRAAVFELGRDVSFTSGLGQKFVETMQQYPLWKSRRSEEWDDS